MIPTLDGAASSREDFRLPAQEEVARPRGGVEQYDAGQLPPLDARRRQHFAVELDASTFVRESRRPPRHGEPRRGEVRSEPVVVPPRRAWSFRDAIPKSCERRLPVGQLMAWTVRLISGRPRTDLGPQTESH